MTLGRTPQDAADAKLAQFVAAGCVPLLSRAPGGPIDFNGRLASGPGIGDRLGEARWTSLTTAYWLRRYGFAPTIVERAPFFVTGGYKIDVRGTALDVLRRMGAHDAVVASSTQMQGALLVDREGNVINRMTGDEFGHRVGGHREIVRGKLFEILMARTAGVDVIFGHAIASIAQSCDGVEVTFRNGDARMFDLVIGAPTASTPMFGDRFSVTSPSTSVTSACTCASTLCRTSCISTVWRCSTPRSGVSRRFGAPVMLSTPRLASASPPEISRSICATALSRRRPYGRSMRTSGGCLASSS